jgi:hypothetical protein
MKTLTKTIMVISAALSVSFMSAKAQVIITEVDPAGSGTSAYGADWFELTNEGSSAVSISGWKMDDNSDSDADAVSLTDISSIAAGQSVVFIEDTGNSKAGITDAQLGAEFTAAWFGSNVPTALTLGYYGGSGVGLGTGGDGVNIFNSSGVQVTGVLFGSSSSNGATFDNSVAQLGGTLGNDPTISTFSVAGVNGAFDSKTSSEVGSPGVAEAPEPSSFMMILGSFGLLALGMRRRITNLL